MTISYLQKKKGLGSLSMQFKFILHYNSYYKNYYFKKTSQHFSLKKDILLIFVVFLHAPVYNY